jgi:diaminohydroxyphosphoribosylaminopyrimidine deaminase / 5-amino-6-(5-phosphoribosylamino)uracil reductase
VVTAQDERMMARALFHAARGRGRTTPNPLVGAVVVSRDGVVVGQGYHERAGEAHAEVHALAAAGSSARGGTLYCTLEPCSHHGRTGPCVERILAAGIDRAVVAVEDPNPLVHGRGFAFLRAHGVDVQVGVGAAPAIDLNRAFFSRVCRGRPFVIAKAAVSLDGCIGEAGRRAQLTSEAANRHAQRLRAEVDAIGVGVGTILADDPLLTCRGVFRERPLTRVIFDRRLRTPASARVLSTRDAGPVMIVTTPAAAARTEAATTLEQAGAELLIVSEPTLRCALDALAAREIGSLLLEGGAAMHAAAWDERVIDFVRMYVTPRTIGPGGVGWLPGRSFSSASLRDRRVETLGPDVLIEGYVHGSR